MSTTYEKSSMDTSEMSELIKAAKQQQLERAQKNAEKQKSNNQDLTTTILDNNTDISSIEHGSYVQTEDGVGAILVDNDYEINKKRENDKTGKALLNLLNSDGLIHNANSYNPNYGSDVPDGYDPGVEFIKENPYDPKTKQLKDIKAGFATLVPGLPGHGLVEADSEEGRLVAEALHKLETGEIVLPTPEEYEQQKKEAMERKNKERIDRRQKAQEALKNNIEEETVEDDNEPHMAEVPDDVVVTKGVEELMNMLDNQQTENEQVVQEVSQPVEQIVVEEPKKVFNLAEAEKAVYEPKEEIQETPVNSEEVKPEEIVNINVAKGEAKELIENLPLETYNKVVKSKVVKVNEVELKDIPTTTRRITSVADYKRLAKRRPRTKSAEVTERVLINSGFVITLTSATSLELATIFKSSANSDVDWEKEYTFCYEHTVGTSIGKLSYNEFVNRVDPTDLETILDGIYEISETDTRSISLTCGNCNTVYDVNVKIADLPVLDELTDDSKKRIKEIIEAKGSIDETKRIVENSPTSIVKYVKCGEDRIFALRTTTGNMLIERIDRVDDIGEQYGPLVALLMLYIENITISVEEKAGAPTTNYLLDTVELICNELLQLNDDELQFIKDIITDSLVQYPVVNYSIKGPCKCPECGTVKDSIPCSIVDLVFQKTLSVLA